MNINQPINIKQLNCLPASVTTGRSEGHVTSDNIKPTKQHRAMASGATPDRAICSLHRTVGVMEARHIFTSALFSAYQGKLTLNNCWMILVATCWLLGLLHYVTWRWHDHASTERLSTCHTGGVKYRLLSSHARVHWRYSIEIQSINTQKYRKLYTEIK